MTTLVPLFLDGSSSFLQDYSDGFEIWQNHTLDCGVSCLDLERMENLHRLIVGEML